MKNENLNYEDVVFSLTHDILKEDIVANSAYIASALHAVSEQPTDVTPFMLTDDEDDFMQRELKCAFFHIMEALSAYLSPETAAPDGATYRIVLRLPTRRKPLLDDLIAHELQRAMACWVLSVWYAGRLPHEATRQRQLYDAAIATARHDVFAACGQVRRGCNYL
jgi:hypothetical protein